MGALDFLRPRAVVASIAPPPDARGQALVPERSNLVAAALRMQQTIDPARYRTRLPWQERAFLYYDILGEIWYASQFYARALSRLELRVMRWSGDADQEPVEVTAADADGGTILGQLERLQDPGGGRSNLLGAYGRLMFLTGECFLLCTTEDGDEAWECLSVDELRWDPQSKSYKRYRAPNTNPEQLDEAPPTQWEASDGTAIAFRLWRRHPRYSALADAPMKAVLDLCEELVLLSRDVRAQARSRTRGAGILLVPEEVSFPPANAEAGDEEPQQDVFIARLTEAMTAPIADEGSASAVVPLVLRVAAEYVQSFVHLRLDDPAAEGPQLDKRMECIKRIALGLDMPPEILLGTADSNHWTAWQIDEQSWKAHLEPIAVQLCEDLTASYFRPSLKAAGIADVDEFFVAYDAAAIIVNPDRGADAKDAHDRLAISDESLRASLGFDDDDAPDEDELVRRIGVKVGDGQLAVTGVPTAAAAPGEPAAPGDEQEPAPGNVDEQAPAEPEGDTDDPGNETAPYSFAVMQEAAGDLIVARCRELAGSRLRSKLQGNTAALALVRHVPNHRVPSVLGEQRMREFEPRQLVAGGAACFRDRLVAWGLDDEAVDDLCNRAEDYAAATLLEAEPRWPAHSQT